jgi:hypothetical protein
MLKLPLLGINFALGLSSCDVLEKSRCQVTMVQEPSCIHSAPLHDGRTGKGIAAPAQPPPPSEEGEYRAACTVAPWRNRRTSREREQKAST